MKKILCAALVVLLIAVCLTGCAKPEKQILGTWTGSSSVLGIVTDYTYEFYEDGTGKMTSAMNIGLETKYSLHDGQLDITTSVLGIENTKSYTYQFEKETLTLTDIGSGDVLVLNKAA